VEHLSAAASELALADLQLVEEEAAEAAEAALEEADKAELWNDVMSLL